MHFKPGVRRLEECAHSNGAMWLTVLGKRSAEDARLSEKTVAPFASCLPSDILSFPNEAAASVQVTTIKHSFILRPGRVLV